MSRPAEARPFPLHFIVPLLIGAALNPINSSIIATALVSIGEDLEVSVAQTAPLVGGLYLASAIAQPTMGKLSTRFGERRVFVAGMGIVGVAGLIGTFATGLGMLLLSRVLIGIGTAAGYPTALALVRRRADRLGTGIPSSVLGALMIAGQVTASLGLPIGGLIVGLSGWRGTFLINVPLVGIGIALTLLWIAPDPPIDRSGSLLRHLDVVGMLLFGGAVAGLMVLLADLGDPSWWLVPVVLVLGAALLAWERRAATPFIDVRMLRRNAPLRATYLRNGGVAVATYCVLYGVSQWMEDGRGLTPGATGLFLLPLSVVGAVSSALTARRRSMRGPLVVCGVAALAGGALLLLVEAGTPLVVLLVVTLLFGVATGAGQVGNQAALYLQTDADEIAVASGLLRTSSYIGAVLSSSIIGLSFAEEASDGGLHAIGLILAALGLLLAVAALGARSLGPLRPGQPAS